MLDTTYAQGVNMAVQNGGGDEGTGTTAGSEAAGNGRIREAQGIHAIAARIAQIEATLASRPDTS